MFVIKQKITKRKIAIAALLAAGVVLGVGVLVSLTEDQDAALSKVLKLDGKGRRVAWSPDGKTLAVVTIYEPLIFRKKGSAVKLWDVDKGEVTDVLAQSAQAFGQVVFSFDGKTIAAPVTEDPQRDRPIFEDVLKLWDAKTLGLKQTLGLGGLHQLACVAFSPDGKLVAAGDPSKRVVKLWNAETGSLERTLDTGEAQPWSLAFSPDGKTLVVGGQIGARPQNDEISGQVQLWNAQTWTLKHVLKQDNYVNTVAFSTNGKMVASGGGGDVVLLWDAQTGELIHSLKRLVRSGTRSVAFSPDSQIIAAGGKDGKVHLWDVQTGKLKASLKGARWGLPGASEIYSLAFSPDGKTLATASQDQTVRLWRVPQGAEVVEKK